MTLSLRPRERGLKPCELQLDAGQDRPTRWADHELADPQRLTLHELLRLPGEELFQDVCRDESGSGRELDRVVGLPALRPFQHRLPGCTWTALAPDWPQLHESAAAPPESAVIQSNAKWWRLHATTQC